ncbi:uncharacterized protein LOC121740818 [Salvia splendens]|uniref:uncharacterized protein LOC121740818 n=1 Tax=Salvia splendens TaxID=180675 RepID=UPI001C265978|nr:uncharacterized protein LOC121740818 [Salvia splendens]
MPILHVLCSKKTKPSSSQLQFKKTRIKIGKRFIIYSFKIRLQIEELTFGEEIGAESGADRRQHLPAATAVCAGQRHRDIDPGTAAATTQRLGPVQQPPPDGSSSSSRRRLHDHRQRHSPAGSNNDSSDDVIPTAAAAGEG